MFPALEVAVTKGRGLSARRAELGGLDTGHSKTSCPGLGGFRRRWALRFVPLRQGRAGGPLGARLPWAPASKVVFPRRLRAPRYDRGLLGCGWLGGGFLRGLAMRERGARANWNAPHGRRGSPAQNDRHICTRVSIDVACSWFGGKLM